ncbi:MAG TPA: GNAT family N-acetyltransferase [Holophagaceae bacterium]|nr:GNAT family N-acetyltransferase [Holophagaceae bacterium]
MKVKDKVRTAVAKARELPAKVRTARANHKLRRTPTGLSFALADAIGQLRPEHWDALTADASVCLSRPFLECLEAAGPSNLQGHYALVYRGARPVAALACQSVDVGAADLPSRKEAAGRLKKARDKGLERVHSRVLVCGNLLGWGPQGVALAPDEDPEELWPAVAEALYRIRRADKLFGETGLVMIKDLTDAEAPSEAPLRRFSYRPVETEPNMVLPLKAAWGDFEGYLQALKSDYRSGIKKQIREVEAAGLVLERLDAEGVAREKAAIHGLYLQVHEKQKMRLVTISEDWIPTLAARFGADFRTTVLRRAADAKIVGFITTLKDRDGAIGYYIGFDKATAAAGVPLYLRLLYALVEDALAMGAAWASLGRTALEPKAKLGARPVAVRCYLRHRVPALNAVVSALLRAVPEPAQAPERKPFKGEA